jgi:hypothetical protein
LVTFYYIESVKDKLKETNRTDMASDIEDAEFIIANYEKMLGCREERA